MLRGTVGSMGGFGVITAAAIRLYQWGGPSELPMSPGEESLEKLPENVDVMVPNFETYEQRDSALYEIGEAEIACFFEFYEADEEQFEEMHDDEKTSVTHGLVGYVAGVIEEVTEKEVEWREA